MAFFLIFKSILDAADGELARVKQKPSNTGRYLDSVADIILNALFFISIWFLVAALPHGKIYKIVLRFLKRKIGHY